MAEVIGLQLGVVCSIQSLPIPEPLNSQEKLSLVTFSCTNLNRCNCVFSWGMTLLGETTSPRLGSVN